MEAAVRDLRDQYPEALVTMHATNGDCIFVDGDLEGLLGYHPEQVIPGGTYQFVHPDDIPVVAMHHQGRLDGQYEGQWMVYRLMHRGGYHVWVQTISILVETEQGPLMGAATLPVQERPKHATITPQPV